MGQASKVKNTGRDGRPRAPVPEIGGDRFTNVSRQRQAALAAALAAHLQQARPPVKIAEFQAGYLARPQAKAGRQQQDRVITQPGGPRPVTARHDSGDVEPGRHRRQPRSLHPGTGGTAAARSAATRLSRRKKRSTDRRPVTRFFGANREPLTLPQQERDDHASA